MPTPEQEKFKQELFMRHTGLDRSPFGIDARTLHQQMVDDFMRRIPGQEAPARPTLPDATVRRLRAALILEEALETIEALGFKATVTDNVRGLNPAGEPNLVEIVDGCCDLKVVTTGTLTACGVADVGPQLEVDVNNLCKFGPGHSIREDGKLIKPPDHPVPDLAVIIKAQQEG